MLCSAAELQISDDHDGIMDLPADAPVGKGYAEWAGLGDPLFEINLTPNRQDCTGVHGIARDLAAAEMGKFKDPAIKPVKGEFPCPVNVTVEDVGLCPGFALRLVRGVKNGPSPQWLQKRLTSIGLRPINALVDITNFMTYDRARPLHVFDAKKVRGHLTVRRARDGETLLALDGRTYTLDTGVCVIADDHGVESLAGIMGGEASGCDESTTDVLIESALWNEINIAQSGRKLGINSDARYRFERGVDPAFMVPGLEMATRMVMEICGGAPSENVVVGNAYGDDRVIDFPLSEVKRLAGIEVPAAADARHPQPARLRDGRQRAGREGRDPVLAHRRAGQGRHRRGGRAHRRRRQGADDAVRPRRRAAQGVADADSVAHSPRQARARRPRHDRGGDVFLHYETGGRIVRRRKERTRARQSDRRRPLGHAAEPAARPDRVRAGQWRSRLCRCRAVRSRSDFQRRSSRGPVHRGRRRPPRFRIIERNWAALVRLGRGRCVRRQG